jgi:hypothetical protein
MHAHVSHWPEPDHAVDDKVDARVEDEAENVEAAKMEHIIFRTTVTRLFAKKSPNFVQTSAKREP